MSSGRSFNASRCPPWCCFPTSYSDSWRPSAHRVERWIVSRLIATAIVAIWALILPRIPEQGDPVPAYISVFLVAFVAQWAGLLLVVAAKLWRAGRDQVTVARLRMRLLSLASLALAVAIIVAATRTGETDSLEIDLAVQAFVLGSAFLFFLGFSPPAFLRVAWRRPEEEAMQEAVLHLMSATNLQEISQDILPHSAEIVAARGAALLDRDGQIIGCYTQNPKDVTPLERLIEHRLGNGKATGDELVERQFPFGSLIVWVSAFTPFFGREEFELFTTLGVLANLSLERSAVMEKERRARGLSNSRMKVSLEGRCSSRKHTRWRTWAVGSGTWTRTR